MTDKQWLDLAKNDLLPYNSTATASTKRRFIALVSKNTKALKQARTLFGDNGVYKAYDYNFLNFMRNFKSGTKTRLGSRKTGLEGKTFEDFWNE